MTVSPDISELVARYLDGRAGPDDPAELDRRLRQEPRAMHVLADSARMEAWLTEHFQKERGMPDIQAALIRAQAAGTPAQRVWRMPGRVWTAAAAAIILLASGAAVWWLARPASPAIELLAGEILVDGKVLPSVPLGRRIDVGGQAPAVLRLPDGSRATLFPDSSAIVRTPGEQMRQRVELLAGQGVFRVAKGRGTFEVQTDLARITVLGTEFSVQLIPERQEKGSTMKTRNAVLAVAVLAGIVQVEFNGQAYRLGPGDNRLFAGDREGGARIFKQSGELTAVGGGSISILQRGDKVQRTSTFTVDGATKVMIESDQMETVRGEGGRTGQRPKIVAGTLEDLKVGQIVEVAADSGGKAVGVLIRRPKPVKREGDGAKPREGDKPAAKPREGEGAGGGKPVAKPREGDGAGKRQKIVGEISSVADGSITISQRGDGGPRTSTVTVDAATKVRIESDQMETVRGEGGKTAQRPKIVDGTLADLKAGQNVVALCDQAGKAMEILIKRPPVQKERKEGEGRKPQPPKVREGEQKPTVAAPRRESAEK